MSDERENPADARVPATGPPPDSDPPRPPPPAAAAAEFFAQYNEDELDRSENLRRSPADVRRTDWFFLFLLTLAGAIAVIGVILLIHLRGKP